MQTILLFLVLQTSPGTLAGLGPFGFNSMEECHYYVHENIPAEMIVIAECVEYHEL